MCKYQCLLQSVPAISATLHLISSFCILPQIRLQILLSAQISSSPLQISWYLQMAPTFRIHVGKCFLALCQESGLFQLKLLQNSLLFTISLPLKLFVNMAISYNGIKNNCVDKVKSQSKHQHFDDCSVTYFSPYVFLLFSSLAPFFPRYSHPCFPRPHRLEVLVREADTKSV